MWKEKGSAVASATSPDNVTGMPECSNEERAELKLSYIDQPKIGQL